MAHRLIGSSTERHTELQLQVTHVRKTRIILTQSIPLLNLIFRLFGVVEDIFSI